MSLLDDFLGDLDREWAAASQQPVRLRVIGSSALMLRTDYRRGTKDADVLELREFGAGVSAALTRLAGKETRLHQRHRIYLDLVASGLPFLPQAPRWHAHQGNGELTAISLDVLDVVDVVVSKLKRFSANDRSDIDAMVQRDLVPHAALVERFRAAVDWHRADAGADRLPRYVQNLHQVERDMLGMPETEIDLDDVHF